MKLFTQFREPCISQSQPMDRRRTVKC